MSTTWEITGSLYYSVYFDTNREVKNNYTSYFDTNRKVQTREDELLGAPSLSVSWQVEPQLPLIVDDTNWEGGGNTWSHTVFDNEGRPEQYATIDFDDRKTSKNLYSFDCDDRGRITLRIPDDIKPGIYTFRERGPTMAPRTIRDFAIVDPWMVYSHGSRHAAGGEDPIYGITKEQIADNADIHPSQVKGGSSLGELVDAYGSNIQEGLERNVSAGHGYYVVEGLDHDLYVNSSLNVREGVCWEDERLRRVSSSLLNFVEDGIYKIYVLNGNIQLKKTDNFPPKSTPLYTVNITGSLSSATITDERLRHNPLVPLSNYQNVKWGAKTSDDLLHRGDNLSVVLEKNITNIRERLSKEDSLHNDFYEKVNTTKKTIEDNKNNLDKAKEIMLSIGYVNSMKQLYSYFNKNIAENLILDNSSKLIDNRMIDVLNYLRSISNGGFNHRSYHISAFSSGDELSSLTNLTVRNGLATLPNNWTSGTQYTLRTLRIPGAPSQYIDFHLVYEYTGASFKVLGSQSSQGKYIPQTMPRIRTIKDDNLKSIFGTTRNCYIDTYRTFFKDPGEESTIELLCVGGDLPDGVRLRGFSIITA